MKGFNTTLDLRRIRPSISKVFISLLVVALGLMGARALSEIDQDLRIMYTEYTLAATDLAHISADIIRYRMMSAEMCARSVAAKVYSVYMMRRSWSISLSARAPINPSATTSRLMKTFEMEGRMRRRSSVVLNPFIAIP